MSLVEVVTAAVRRNAIHAGVSFTPQSDLLQLGVLDSMGILAVAADLEVELGCPIAPEHFLPENFRSVGCIVQLSERLLEEVRGAR